MIQFLSQQNNIARVESTLVAEDGVWLASDGVRKRIAQNPLLSPFPQDRSRCKLWPTFCCLHELGSFLFGREEKSCKQVIFW